MPAKGVHSPAPSPGPTAPALDIGKLKDELDDAQERIDAVFERNEQHLKNDVERQKQLDELIERQKELAKEINERCGPKDKPPVTPTPEPTPDKPPADKPPPQKDCKPCEVDYERIVKEVAEQLVKDGRLRGPEGPKGAIGPPGKPGKDTTIDYDLLAKEVIKRLPPIYPQWIDNDGNVIDSIPGGVRLGQTMPLRLEVVIRQLLDDRDAANARPK